MGQINLLVTNANQKFTDRELATIRRAAKSAEKFVSDNFDFDYDVDIVIVAPSFLLDAIPEDGISGRTFSSQLIVIVLDKQQSPIREAIVFETICHEMSHSLRWKKLPEYSKTLFDGMIMEGLAIVLEEKAMEDTGRGIRQFFLREMQSTSQKMIDDMLAQLDGQLDSETYDYSTIFFTGNDKLPRWAGYRLGYYFVKQYLEAIGSTISEATLASYSSFKKL